MSCLYWALQYSRTSRTKQMKDKLWWFVRTEYYSTNVLAH